MITRPNGKTYRPRKPGLRVHAWEDDDESGVIVFGTLDDAPLTRDRARDACASWFGDADTCDVVDALPGWYRNGYDHHEPAWIIDEHRGAPGVRYTWTEKP